MENPFLVMDQRLAHLEDLLSELLSKPTAVASAPERPITALEAAKILNISKGAVYNNTDVIPCHKRHGQYYFFESELIAYLKGEWTSPAKAPKTILQPKPARKAATVA